MAVAVFGNVGSAGPASRPGWLVPAGSTALNLSGPVPGEAEVLEAEERCGVKSARAGCGTLAAEERCGVRRGR